MVDLSLLQLSPASEVQGFSPAFRPFRPSGFVEMIELFVGRPGIEPSCKANVSFVKAP
jgi:hypothetical protein